MSKVWLKNKGKGWYETKEDYSEKGKYDYMTYRFRKCEEPQGDNICIDVKSFAHNYNKGKWSVAVFDYSVVEEAERKKDEVKIDPEELPFY